MRLAEMRKAWLYVRDCWKREQLDGETESIVQMSAPVTHRSRLYPDEESLRRGVVDSIAGKSVCSQGAH